MEAEVRNDGLVLVTGAPGGTQGSTGGHLVHALLRRGQPVRAVVRQYDDRSAALERAGAEVVEADLLDLDQTARATEGCRAVAFIYPVAPGLIEATAIMASAAKQAGLHLLVNLAHLNTGPEAPSPHTRRHWLGEEVLRWSAVPTCFVRAAVFHENIAQNAVPGVREASELRLPLGAPGTPIPLIAAGDVAAAIAAILSDPAAHAGQTYPLVGEVQQPTGIAEAISRAVERKVAYHPLSEERWAEYAASENVADNVTAAEHLNKLWWTLAHPDPEMAGQLRQVNSTLTALGVSPTDFATFARTRFSRASL